MSETKVKLELDLAESEERYRGLYESSIDGILSMDLEGKIVECNQAFADMLGYAKEEVYNLTYRELTPSKWLDMEAKIVTEQLPIRGYSEEYEKEHIRKDGTIFSVSVRVWLIRDKEGTPTGSWGIIRDITERKYAEEELKKYSERLEETVEELRDAQEQLVHKEKLAVIGQLAGGVSHELRNPLGAIKNAVYFLNMVLEKPEPEVKETLEILEKEVAISERIISSLLDFARSKPPTRRKVNINDVIQETLSRIKVAENVAVASHLEEVLPILLADPDQLGQVFENIVINAIQAMPKGGQLTVTSQSPSPKWVTIAFSDTGVGIPEENREKLFTPLFTTKAKGIGLGLTITKTIVEAHGGTIEVQSEVGKGSTFTVKLPVGWMEEK
jgi:PAS domain S-box-containing protein